MSQMTARKRRLTDREWVRRKYPLAICEKYWPGVWFVMEHAGATDSLNDGRRTARGAWSNAARNLGRRKAK